MFATLLIVPPLNFGTFGHPSMLPVELYHGIIGNLDVDCHRETLLSAAQCCTVLRAECQRVLFRSTSGIPWYQPDQVYRHKLFLGAVIGAPERLALYVKEFVQLAIAWEPGYWMELASQGRRLVTVQSSIGNRRRRHARL